MKLTYVFSKDPKRGAHFEIVRTVLSTDAKRIIEIKFVETSSDKFKDLQVNDVLITQSDNFKKNVDDIVVINHIEGNLITVNGFSKNIYGIREFEDGETLYFLARVKPSNA